MDPGPWGPAGSCRKGRGRGRGWVRTQRGAFPLASVLSTTLDLTLNMRMCKVTADLCGKNYECGEVEIILL